MAAWKYVCEQLQWLPCVQRGDSIDEKQNFKCILRDSVLTFFQKHKFASYKQMTIQHLYLTNKAAGYGTHSLEKILQCLPATKEKLPKRHALSNNREGPVYA